MPVGHLFEGQSVTLPVIFDGIILSEEPRIFAAGSTEQFETIQTVHETRR